MSFHLSQLFGDEIPLLWGVEAEKGAVSAICPHRCSHTPSLSPPPSARSSSFQPVTAMGHGQELGRWGQRRFPLGKQEQKTQSRKAEPASFPGSPKLPADCCELRGALSCGARLSSALLQTRGLPVTVLQPDISLCPRDLSSRPPRCLWSTLGFSASSRPSTLNKKLWPLNAETSPEPRHRMCWGKERVPAGVALDLTGLCTCWERDE